MVKIKARTATTSVCSFRWCDFATTKEEEVFVAKLASMPKTFTAEAEGAAGLDSCCSKTMMGRFWFDGYKKLISKDMKQEIEGPIKTDMDFIFGDGGKLK